MKRGQASLGISRVAPRLRPLVLAALLPALLAVPGNAAERINVKKRGMVVAPQALSLTAPGSLGSFTPADSHFGTMNHGTEAAFRFTPAGKPGRRAVTVTLRSRIVPKTEMVRAQTVANASAYNLGVSVGWKRFALTGEVAKVDTGMAPFSREGADVGLSYLGKNWRTTLQLAADRPTGDQLAIAADSNYSVDLGGAYAISRNLALSGGVRYQLRRDRLTPVDTGSGHDAQSVYVGTAFRF
jgi:hypothetical protein